MFKIIFITLILNLYSTFVYGNQFNFFKGSVEYTTLTCSIDNFDKQSPYEYTLKWLDKNNKLEHTLFDKTAKLENYQTKFLIEKYYSGSINVYNKKNIIWSYEKFMKYNAPLGKPRADKIRIKNIYRLKSNTYFINIIRGSYTLASAQGKCELNNSDPKTIKMANKQKLDTELEAKRLAEEKTQLEAELKAQKLAEEKAQLEAKLKAQKLAEEKAQLEAKLKAQKLAEEKAQLEAELKAQKLAEEKAKRKAELKAKKLAEEKAKRKAELKAKKLAKEKAKKLAENRAKEDAERIKINLLKKESEEFLFNVQSFAMDKNNDLDTLKLGMLFLNFKKSSKNGWNKETLNNYKLLKNFALSSIKFKSFYENQKLVKLKKINEEVSRLQKSIKGFEEILRSFVSVNLGSENSLVAINFANEINKLEKSKNLSKLSNLEKRLINWKSKNIKITIPNKKEIKNVKKENSKKTKNVNEKKIEKNLKEHIIIKASGCKNYFNSEEKKDDFEKVVGYKYWTGFSIQYEIINKTSHPLVIRKIATEFSRDYGPFYTLLKTPTFAKPILPNGSLMMKRDPHMFYTLAKESLKEKQIEELKNRYGCSLSNFEGQTIDLVKGQIKMKFPPDVKSLKPLDIIKIQNKIEGLGFNYR